MRAGGDAARHPGLVARPGRQGLAHGDAGRGRGGADRDRHPRAGRPRRGDRVRRIGGAAMSGSNRVLWSEGLFLRAAAFPAAGPRHRGAGARGAAGRAPAALGLRARSRSIRRCSRPGGSRWPRPAASSRTAPPSPFPRPWRRPSRSRSAATPPAGAGAAGAAGRGAGRRELRSGPCRAVRRPLPRRHRAGARRGARRRRARGDRDRPAGRAAACARKGGGRLHHAAGRRGDRAAGRRRRRAAPRISCRRRSPRRRCPSTRQLLAGAGHRARPDRRGARPDGARRRRAQRREPAGARARQHGATAARPHGRRRTSSTRPSCSSSSPASPGGWRPTARARGG